MPIRIHTAIPPPDMKWKAITMDFTASLPKKLSNRSEIQNFVCNLSEMIRLIPIISDIDSPGVSEMFKERIYHNKGVLDKSFLIRTSYS